MAVVPHPTGRLTFREWNLGDLEPFHWICSEPRVMRYVGSGQPWTRKQTQGFIDRARSTARELGYCQWPLVHTNESKLIGYCGFASSDEGPEIGWRLGVDYWGQGLATEAAVAVLEHGFESFDFRRVIATVQAPNTASIRLVEKLGMKRQHILQRDGRELVVYAVEK